MKMRFTPLNLVCSALLVEMVWLAVSQRSFAQIGLLSLLLIISFISDLLFRRFLINLKRIWIVELVFIIFAVVLILIINKF